MKVGRNEPCPCGSGKKYKKCCMAKNEEAELSKYSEYDSESSVIRIHENSNAEAVENRVEEDDEELDMRTLLLRAMVNLRQMTMKNKPHIKEYKNIRKLHKEIVDSIVIYIQDGKFEQKIDKDYGKTADNKPPEELIVFDTVFDMEDDVGAQGWVNLNVYKNSVNMQCVTEDYIEKKRFRKPEKIEFLHSMLDSHAGLFEITGADKDEGYVYLRDVLSNQEYKIIDIALSAQLNDDIYMYNRIITYKDISFGTGIGISFSKKDLFITDWIKRNKKDYMIKQELIRFLELFNRYTTDSNNIKTIKNNL
ncbi:MAG: SEC-C domain-containing protein [Oscillospiraceae bacterium]|nr:SEC-C domain-containing protein [Oscillospiraceae bacterium]